MPYGIALPRGLVIAGSETSAGKQRTCGRAEGPFAVVVAAEGCRRAWGAAVCGDGREQALGDDPGSPARRGGPGHAYRLGMVDAPLRALLRVSVLAGAKIFVSGGTGVGNPHNSLRHPVTERPCDRKTL
jgi:hypothetical protein